MENDKPTINEELDHIRNSINQKNKKHNNTDSFILLDKIVSKGKKYHKKTQNEIKSNNEDVKQKNNNITNHRNINNKSKLSNPKKNVVDNISKPLKKPKDPVEALVDREIKPIIKQWISKNLKSFVKKIVIQEMKLISKATQKHK